MLAVPVLIVFTGLLSSADTVFAGYVNNLTRFDFLSNAPEAIWRTALMLAAGAKAARVIGMGQKGEKAK